MQKIDLKCKMILLGDSSTGKTSINHWIQYQRFNDYICSTIGAQFMTYRLIFENYLLTFDIWDTAGQERYRSLINMYFRNVDICLIVFDIQNYNIDNIKYWLYEFRNINNNPDAIIVIVGNKMDLNRDFTPDRTLKQFLTENNLKLFLTSAFDGTNLEDMFSWMSKEYITSKNIIPEQMAAEKSSFQLNGWSLLSESKKYITRLFSC